MRKDNVAQIGDRLRLLQEQALMDGHRKEMMPLEFHRLARAWGLIRNSPALIANL